MSNVCKYSYKKIMKNNAKLSPFTKTDKGDNKIILLSLTMTSYLPSQAYKIILLCLKSDSRRLLHSLEIYMEWILV